MWFRKQNPKREYRQQEDVNVQMIRTGKGYMRFKTNLKVNVPPAKPGLEIRSMKKDQDLHS